VHQGQPDFEENQVYLDYLEDLEYQDQLDEQDHEDIRELWELTVKQVMLVHVDQEEIQDQMDL